MSEADRAQRSGSQKQVIFCRVFFFRLFFPFYFLPSRSKSASPCAAPHDSVQSRAVPSLFDPVQPRAVLLCLTATDPQRFVRSRARAVPHLPTASAWRRCATIGCSMALGTKRWISSSQQCQNRRPSARSLRRRSVSLPGFSISRGCPIGERGRSERWRRNVSSSLPRD